MLKDKNPGIIILNDHESAAFFYHDLVQLTGEKDVFFLPSSYKRSPEQGRKDPQNVLMRTETLNALLNNPDGIFVVTYPDAVAEKVIASSVLEDHTLKISKGDKLDTSFITDLLGEYDFSRVDYVFEPGQYSVRGSIIDIFSFSNDNPYRIDLFGDEVDSIRSFDLETQLSTENLQSVEIIPDITNNELEESFVPFSDFMPGNSIIWIEDIRFTSEIIDKIKTRLDSAQYIDEDTYEESKIPSSDDFCISSELFNPMEKMKVLTFNTHVEQLQKHTSTIPLNTSPQPVFHKNFDLLEENLSELNDKEYSTFILSDNPKQLERLKAIFEDKGSSILYEETNHSLHEGFIDNDNKIAVYTDHQIFERYHKFSLRTEKTKSAQQALTLKELNRLNPGNYVVHIDHGIGKFGGLVTTEVNGQVQEAIRLIYRDNDVLLVSIHSLHRISKYKGKDGTPPKINKLGTAAWKNLKKKTKSKVKDIARELISLYAKRKSQPGFAFSPDSYLQTELESSFIYEDTPDQVKTTQAVKKDMESHTPMDRLVCGDVGFGKTEIAIRAAFKAVTDNKQVAVLVPTTILALQHYTTFKERLKNFPVKVDYISRLRTAKSIKNALKDLKDGNLDIIIGTHRLVGKDVEFKDLGLLIIDEEQRFGVAVKEKLKNFRVNVDTLTLTATPIPRTLQFSLMGARDLSILNTPPPNRHPINTELHTFNEDVIKEAITYETERNGQVFFINNRVQNIYEIEELVRRILPDIRIITAHGQMDGPKLEKIMLDFIAGEYDVLIATTIIESGLDIPNANTIIINDAHRFGLSELHQLRGRVGRANKKAFCYLLAPPLSTLTQEARRRLKIIEEFSDLGSGFNIAMQDLDIRGAGDILGAEQSGFISDIGYETYMRILNEAVQELKETEYKEVFVTELEQKAKESQVFVPDCQIETDIEMRFPEDYISNISERMQLYRELDSLNEEDELLTFEKNLTDRFGPVPERAKTLFDIVRMRRTAKKLGIEKIVFKYNKLYLYFIANQESYFYNSPQFGKILQWLQENPLVAEMKEGKGKLYLHVKKTDSVTKIKKLLDEIESFVYENIRSE
ncbi:MAG: transcription-repair coupling factor [Chlorobi bacterium]|nr:transcription-repair coupling factor [Chlorobiota bacterium]